METTVQTERNYPFTPEGKIESLEKKIKEVDSLLEDMSVPIEELRAGNQVLEIIYHLAFKGDSWMLETKQELLWAAYAGSRIISSHILDDEPMASQQDSLLLGV